MKKETFNCPFCKGTIQKKPLYSSKHYKCRLRKLQIEQRKKVSAATAGGSLPVENPNKKAIDDLSLDEIKTLLSNKKNNLLRWKMPQNLAANELSDVIHNTRLLCENNGVQEPKNYEGSNYCHVINDFWYACFLRAYDKKGQPKVYVDIHENQFALYVTDDRLSADHHCLALGLEPVCPHCNMILPACVLDLNDKTLHINLIGDPSTGKSVWQITLAAFLKRKGGHYRISKEYELCLAEGINPYLESRMNNFCENGELPDQTRRTAAAARNLRAGAANNANAGNFDPWNPNANADVFGNARPDAAQANNATAALPLLLILKKYGENDRVETVRFLSISDYAGENLKDKEQGITDVDKFRHCHALFFFADICSETGLESVTGFMQTPHNLSAPYFGFMIPKADKSRFCEILKETLVDLFVKGFVRVITFNIPDARPNTAKVLGELFAQNFLHYSPEEIGGALCHYNRRLLEQSLLQPIGQDGIMQLYGELVQHRHFAEVFPWKNADEWVGSLLAEDKMFYTDLPDATEPVRGSDAGRRLMNTYFLRNIFAKYGFDFESAGKCSGDIGFFLLSALGSNYDAVNSPMKIEPAAWAPKNLFDPLLGFLHSIY